MEVMVTAGMMSGTAMLMATMAKQTAVQSSAQIARTNLDNEIIAWRSVLGDNEKCTAAFSGVSMPGGAGYVYTGATTIASGGLKLKIGASLGTDKTKIVGLQILGVGEVYLGVPVAASATSMPYMLPTGVVTVRTLVTALRVSTSPPPSTTITPHRDIGMIISYDTTSGAIRACTSSINQGTMCGELGGLMYGGLCTQWQRAMSLQSVAIGSTAVPGSVGASPGTYLNSGGAAFIGGSLTAGTSALSSLTVTGASALNSLEVTGMSTLSSLTVTGTSTLNLLAVAGASTLSTVTVSGLASFNAGLSVPGSASIDKLTATFLKPPISAVGKTLYGACSTTGEVFYTPGDGIYLCNKDSKWEKIKVY